MKFNKSVLKLVKPLLAFLLTCSASSIFAGGPVAPPMPVWQGVYVGVGGSYSNVKVRTDYSRDQFDQDGVILPNNATVSGSLSLNTHQLTPVADLGFWYNVFGPEWYLGLKGVYKYLAVRVDSGNGGADYTNAAEAPPVAGWQTTVDHEAYFLIMGGFSFDHWLLYLGVGPSLFTLKTLRDQGVAVGTGFPYSNRASGCKTLWGGAFQVGFSVMLPMNFFVDMSYAFAASGKKTIDNLNVMTSSNANTPVYRWSTKSRIISNEIIITVNKLFNF